MRKNTKSINKKPLYMQLEENFSNQEGQSLLEHKKKVLQDIRSFHKPIDGTELREHAKNFQKTRE